MKESSKRRKKKLASPQNDRRLAERFDTNASAREWHESEPATVRFKRPIKHLVRLADGRRVTLADFGQEDRRLGGKPVFLAEIRI